MWNKLKTDHFNLVLMMVLFFIIVEILFFHSGLIFSLLFSSWLIYIGRKKYNKTIGVILFWIGIVSLTVTIFNMFAAKFLILAIILYIFYHYTQSKKHPIKKNPIILEKKPIETEKPIIKKKPLFQNRFYGSIKTDEYVYDWNDINIQGVLGDTVIDLSYTVLPKGESVISIRHFIGNVRILVPYEMEVVVHHSSFFGKAAILGHEESKMFNCVLSYQTPEYEQAAQKIKIITSMVSGDLEVKRV